MDLITLNHFTSSEKNARRFFLGFCWKNHQRFCPRCRERKLYRVSDGRRRCARCLYTFHDFSQRFINGSGLTFQQWLLFLKLFELDIAHEEIVKQLQISYPTVLKVKDLIRRAILAQALDASTLYAKGVWPGPGRSKPGITMRNSPVFGVMDLGGYIICDVLPDIDVDNIIHYKMSFHLKTGSIGPVVFTGPYKQYTMLLACGPDLWPTGFIQHNDQHISGMSTEFGQFAKKYLKHPRSISPANFPLWLKEWEMRFNHREKCMTSVLAEAVCAFVPHYGVCEEKDNSGDDLPACAS